MAFDPAGDRVFVVFRSPTRLAAYSAKEGVEQARIDTCGDSDDVFFDPKRERLYVSCGEGFIDVFQLRETRFTRIARIPTVSGARTSFFVAAWDRLYLAVRATTSAPAAIWIFKPSP
jgi:hypothetical protein